MRFNVKPTVRGNFCCSISPNRTIVGRTSLPIVRTGVTRLITGGRTIIHTSVTGGSTLGVFNSHNRACGYRLVSRLRSNRVAACARKTFASLYHNPRLLAATPVGTVGLASITNTC